eukprot:scaffold207_cov60-Phaeocystis_antarctica.AAC.4
MAHAREQCSGMARLNRDSTILSRGSHLVRPSLPGLHSFHARSEGRRAACGLEKVSRKPASEDRSRLTRESFRPPLAITLPAVLSFTYHTPLM